MRGKNKPQYTPHADAGDYVVVINAEKVKLTGNKVEQKVYQSHSGYMGHLKTKLFKDVMANNPEDIIFNAVRGMLPKNRLQKKWLANLTIYKEEINE